jgi:hypothetical protein
VVKLLLVLAAPRRRRTRHVEASGRDVRRRRRSKGSEAPSLVSTFSTVHSLTEPALRTAFHAAAQRTLSCPLLAWASRATTIFTIFTILHKKEGSCLAWLSLQYRCGFSAVPCVCLGALVPCGTVQCHSQSTTILTMRGKRSSGAEAREAMKTRRPRRRSDLGAKHNRKHLLRRRKTCNGDSDR